jgi:Carboxypeptidase regulatory-like domain
MVVALVAGAIGVVAVPTAAFAATKVDVSPGNADLQPGDSQTFTLSIYGDPGSHQVAVNLNGLGSDVSLTDTSNDVNCSGNSCGGSVNLNVSQNDPDHALKIQVTARAKSQVSVAAGQTATGNGTVIVDGAQGTFKVTLHGPAAQQQPTQGPTTVTKISGVVKDSSTGSGIGGVKVQLQDQNSNQFTTTSNSAGAYQFTSTSAKPIIAGLMAITATKDGYTYDPHPFNTTAGQPATFDIVMISAAAPSSSALPDGGGISSAPAASDSASDVVADTASSGGSSNHYLTFMIIAGALLILAGIGAILTLVLRRRKEDEDDEDEDDMPPPRRGPPPGRPGAGYRGAQPTAVVAARDPGYDDRTAIVRPVEDEFPDPYGAPPPRTPAPAYGGGGQYGGQRPGYGQQAGGFEQPTAYSPAARPPADPYAAGYGDSGRGGRYDEPTGIYNGGGQPYGGEPTAAGSGQYGGGQYGGSGDQYGGGQYGSGAPERGRSYDNGGGNDQYGSGTYGAGNGQYAGQGGQYGSGGFQDEQYPPAADPYRDDTRHAGDQGYGDPAPRSAPPRAGQPQPGRQYGGYDQAYDPQGQQGYGEPRPTSGAPRGHGQPTQQYGGYDQAYDPRGGYDQQQQGGFDPASRHSAAPGRGGQDGRRSLDWLDD